MKVYEIEPNRGLSRCTEKDISGISCWLEMSEPGDIITIRVKEMSESEYNSLPEYTGP